jgi:hypothetical protein
MGYYDAKGQGAAQRAYDNACDCCDNHHHAEPTAPYPLSNWKWRKQRREQLGRPELRWSYPIIDSRTGLPAHTMRRTHREPDPLYRLRVLRHGVVYPPKRLGVKPQSQAEVFIQARRNYGALLAEITSPVVLP